MSKQQEIEQLAFRLTARAVKDGQHRLLGMSCEDLLDFNRFNLLHTSDHARKELFRWLKKKEKEGYGCQQLGTISF